MIRFVSSNIKLLMRDIIIVLFIISTPLLIYIHQLFPVKVNFYENPFFSIKSNYYNDIQAFVYMISMKLVFILMYSIWYISCKNWWKSILIIPIVFGVYQLIIVISDEIKFVDDFDELVYSLLVAVPMIILLYFFSKRLVYYTKSQHLSESISREIDSLIIDISNFKTNDFKSLRDEVLELRKQKSNMEKEDYLIKLFKLRDHLNNL